MEYAISKFTVESFLKFLGTIVNLIGDIALSISLLTIALGVFCLMFRKTKVLRFGAISYLISLVINALARGF